MDNPRRYGAPPFRVVLVHGGPGPVGEMARVARDAFFAALEGALAPA